MNCNDIFIYDETSRTCLRWKSNSRGVGQLREAGNKGTRKGRKDYIRVRFNKRLVSVSRIIWEMFNGKILEGMIIDHLDGDIWNNKISNLEMKTRRENSQNQKRRSDNRSGVPGISVCKQEKGKYVYNYVFAYVGCGRGRAKVFSIDKLGIDEAMRLAIEWRKMKVEQENANGQKYTDRHVTDCLNSEREE